MIHIFLPERKYQLDIFNLIRIFNKIDDLEFHHDLDIENKTTKSIKIYLNQNEEGIYTLAELIIDNKIQFTEKTLLKDLIFLTDNIEKRKKTLVKNNLYKLLSKYYKISSDYGILTGIRPVKLFRLASENEFTKDYIRKVLKETYLLSEYCINTLDSTYEIEKFKISSNIKNISLYFGIPFCPSRCKFCSFNSYINKNTEEIDEYIDILIKEAKRNVDILTEFNLNIDSIYIGGGTPSILNANQIYKLLNNINAIFRIDKNTEFTFEAGRPKTINKEKLRVMKEQGINRISINPQTMNDSTLKLINRNHTVLDIMNAFATAREEGFGNINMDFISGLPNENITHAIKNLEYIKILNPENVTVHNLSIKKGSEYHKNNYVNKLSSDEINLINSTYKTTLDNLGMNIYYLYRQKNIFGNADNCGFSFTGNESIYNINIVEELQTILAFGAGSISKIVNKKDNRIYRVPNNKNIYSYKQKIEEKYFERKLLIKDILT